MLPQVSHAAFAAHARAFEPGLLLATPADVALERSYFASDMTDLSQALQSEMESLPPIRHQDLRRLSAQAFHVDELARIARGTPLSQFHLLGLRPGEDAQLEGMEALGDAEELLGRFRVLQLLERKVLNDVRDTRAHPEDQLLEWVRLAERDPAEAQVQLGDFYNALDGSVYARLRNELTRLWQSHVYVDKEARRLVLGEYTIRLPIRELLNPPAARSIVEDMMSNGPERPCSLVREALAKTVPPNALCLLALSHRLFVHAGDGLPESLVTHVKARLPEHWAFCALRAMEELPWCADESTGTLFIRVSESMAEGELVAKAVELAARGLDFALHERGALFSEQTLWRNLCKGLPEPHNTPQDELAACITRYLVPTPVYQGRKLVYVLTRADVWNRSQDNFHQMGRLFDTHVRKALANPDHDVFRASTRVRYVLAQNERAPPERRRSQANRDWVRMLHEHQRYFEEHGL
jgi:hypothetical protein